MIQAYDATKIIDALKCCAYGDRSCDKCPVGKDCKGMTNKAMTLAIEWIEMEATKKQPHWIDNWISVKDRLPENQNPVMVFVPPHVDEIKGTFLGYVGMAYYTSLGEGFWCGTDGNLYGAIGMIHTPTHWMPLPEPPKEDE